MNDQRADAHERMPIVSVIMPAFNAELYIEQALNSVAEQTMSSLEVIVVDDGSTDGTLAKIKPFADRLDVTVLHQVNAGPSAARNVGIRRARGRYCAFLDADDLMLPDLLATQAAVLDGDPAVGLVVTDITTFNDTGTIRENHWNIAGTTGAPLERLVIENFVTTSAAMSPTAMLLEAGLFPEDRRVAEDYELWLRLATRWQLAVVPRSLVRYRYAPGSLSSDKVNSTRCALEVIEAFWRDHPDYLRRHAGVAHRSMARHLTNAGRAAVQHGRRGLALRYLVRSLGHDPAAVDCWAALTKVLLPVGALKRRPAQSEAESARAQNSDARA